MIDWKIPIGAIIIILVAEGIKHWLSKRESYKKDVGKFKESFVPFIKAMESPDAHPNVLLVHYFADQDVAARKFVLRMRKRKKQRFLQRWEKYAALCREKQSQGIFAQLGTELDDPSKALLGTFGAGQYIANQTSMRIKRALRLLNEALDGL
jgi:hypothetical protein